MVYYILIPLIAIIGVVVLVFVTLALARAYERHLTKNMKSVTNGIYVPIEQNMPATVLKKSTPSTSLFQVTFGFPDGTEHDFRVSQDVFDTLTVGDKGTIYYRGLFDDLRFVRFVKS